MHSLHTCVDNRDHLLEIEVFTSIIWNSSAQKIRILSPSPLVSSSIYLSV